MNIVIAHVLKQSICAVRDICPGLERLGFFMPRPGNAWMNVQSGEAREKHAMQNHLEVDMTAEIVRCELRVIVMDREKIVSWRRGQG